MNKKQVIKKLEEASTLVSRVIKKTPLLYSHFLSEEYNANIYLKAENLQRTGSFKIRGAYNKIASLSDEERKRGLIASSAGNHAQGVSLAAKECGAQAVIVMPLNTPLIKVEATRHYGAEVVLFGDCYDDAYQEALRLQKENNYIFIHPFDDEAVIYGQATIALEILEQLNAIDVVIVPIGGGGLISGISLAIKTINPNIKVVGVEPQGAQTLKEALKNNGVCELKKVDTIAEGVAVRKAGKITYRYVKNYVDDIVTVSDANIMEAFLLVTEREKIIAENAGALSVAALKKLDIKKKNVVSVISGGNIDVVTISELINRGLVVRGRIFCFAVELSDTPGELKKIASILAEHGANVIKLDHNQFKTIDRFKHVILEITCETNGKKHVSEIKKRLKQEGYVLQVIY